MDPMGEQATERWGDLPSLSTVTMHDMLAAALAANVSSVDASGDVADLGDGEQYPEANSLFREVSSVVEQSREPKTSPFYETLKVLLKDVPEEVEESPLEDPNTYTPIAKALRDSVILIVTHAGFSQASNHCIDVLADLLQYYLEKFTMLMRQFTDSADFSSPTDFVDTFTKVLHHMSVPDLDALRKFNNELILYEAKVKKTAEKTTK